MRFDLPDEAAEYFYGPNERFLICISLRSLLTIHDLYAAGEVVYSQQLDFRFACISPDARFICGRRMSDSTALVFEIDWDRFCPEDRTLTAEARGYVELFRERSPINRPSDEKALISYMQTHACGFTDEGELLAAYREGRTHGADEVTEPVTVEKKYDAVIVYTRTDEERARFIFGKLKKNRLNVLLAPYPNDDNPDEALLTEQIASSWSLFYLMGEGDEHYRQLHTAATYKVFTVFVDAGRDKKVKYGGAGEVTSVEKLRKRSELRSMVKQINGWKEQKQDIWEEMKTN